MSPSSSKEPRRRLDVVIVGGGQSGLALGYYLSHQRRSFVILDSGPRVGHVWRNRWDTLQLITPCPYNDLPGLRFPGAAWTFPHKDQVADYLEEYARRFALPVLLGHRVRAVRKRGELYEVDTPGTLFEAPVVVIATGPFHAPKVPPFASLDSEAHGDGRPFQIHSSAYKNPAQIPPGEVLVVGCGNSGAGIAQDLASSHRVHLALGRTAHIPRRILNRDVFWWAHLSGLIRVTIRSRRGQRMSRQPDALIGTSPKELAQTFGVVIQPRVTTMNRSEVGFTGGTSHRYDAVIWATGYRPDYTWIHMPVFDDHGAPIHERGLTREPGLFFLGLKWLHRVDSSLLGGVGKDAKYTSRRIDRFFSGHMAP